MLCQFRCLCSGVGACLTYFEGLAVGFIASSLWGEVDFGGMFSASSIAAPGLFSVPAIFPRSAASFSSLRDAIAVGSEDGLVVLQTGKPNGRDDFWGIFS